MHPSKERKTCSSWEKLWYLLEAQWFCINHGFSRTEMITSHDSLNRHWEDAAQIPTKRKAVFAKLLVKAELQLDTRESVNILPVSSVPYITYSPTQRRLVMWKSAKVLVKWKAASKTTKHEENQSSTIKFVVFGQSYVPIFGLDFVENLNLISFHYESFVHENSCNAEYYLENYASVFDNTLGELPLVVTLDIN